VHGETSGHVPTGRLDVVDRSLVPPPPVCRCGVAGRRPSHVFPFDIDVQSRVVIDIRAEVTDTLVWRACARSSARLRSSLTYRSSLFDTRPAPW
jgi:hypothetical protein